MTRGLLLRELEVGATGEQVLDQRVQGFSFALGDADQVLVKGWEDADLGLAARFGHVADSNACATMALRQIGLAVSHHPALYSRSCFL